MTLRPAYAQAAVDPESFWGAAGELVTWFTRPSAVRDGDTWFPRATLNLCFNAIDRHVVAGHADRPALAEGGVVIAYADLLEHSATLGGVVRGLGAAAGARVAVDLPLSGAAVIAALACARIGAVHVTGPDPDAAVTITRGDGGIELRPAAGGPLGWDLAMKAGRTDPAASLEVAAGHPLSIAPDGTVNDTGRHTAALAWERARGTVRVADTDDALAALIGGATAVVG